MSFVNKGKWVDGLAHWEDGETAYLSVVFTWRVLEAVRLAVYYRGIGRKVIAGGPALFIPAMQKLIEPYAEIQTSFPDAIRFHHPLATVASRGCPVGCWFCIVPKMEGRKFTLLPDFPVRPVLCDNNLSALPMEFQKHIVGRYKAEGVPLLDANSGFEPATFSDEIYRLWSEINQGPWRFAYDELKERDDVRRVLQMLKNEPARKKRVYVLIGNEPFEQCMERIEEVVTMGGEPHVQPFIKLNALRKEPNPRHDWTVQKLRDVARWVNGFVYRKTPFSEYDRRKRTTRPQIPGNIDAIFGDL